MVARTLRDLGRRRRERRVQVAADEHVARIEGREQQSRNRASHEEVADRDVGAEPVDDHDDRGRDQRRERARGADQADGDLPVVAEAQHLRQRHQTEHDDFAAHHARHRRQDDGDDRRLNRDAAAQVAREDGHGVEQVFRDAGALQDGGHQHEERHGDERIMLQEAGRVGGDEVEAAGAEEGDGEQHRDDQRDDAERHARHHQRDEDRHHDDADRAEVVGAGVERVGRVERFADGREEAAQLAEDGVGADIVGQRRSAQIDEDGGGQELDQQLRKSCADMPVQVHQKLGQIDRRAGRQHRLQHHRHGRVEGAAGALDHVDRVIGAHDGVGEQQEERRNADEHGEEVEAPPDAGRRHDMEDGDGDMPALQGHEAGGQHPGARAERHDHFERPLRRRVENVAHDHFVERDRGAEQVELRDRKAQEVAEVVDGRVVGAAHALVFMQWVLHADLGLDFRQCGRSLVHGASKMLCRKRTRRRCDGAADLRSVISEIGARREAAARRPITSSEGPCAP